MGRATASLFAGAGSRLRPTRNEYDRQSVGITAVRFGKGPDQVDTNSLWKYAALLSASERNRRSRRPPGDSPSPQDASLKNENCRK